MTSQRSAVETRTHGMHVHKLKEAGVQVGHLIKSFPAVQKLARASAPAFISVPLQQVLREVSTVCLDYARFALAHAVDARSIEAAQTDLNQLAFSSVWIPNCNFVPGTVVAARLRGLAVEDCRALDAWLTTDLTKTLYGVDADEATECSALVSCEQVRALLDYMIRSGELTIPQTFTQFVRREVFGEDVTDDEGDVGEVESQSDAGAEDEVVESDAVVGGVDEAVATTDTGVAPFDDASDAGAGDGADE